jgi:hypothetical protein
LWPGYGGAAGGVRWFPDTDPVTPNSLRRRTELVVDLAELLPETPDPSGRLAPSSVLPHDALTHPSDSPGGEPTEDTHATDVTMDYAPTDGSGGVDVDFDSDAFVSGSAYGTPGCDF